MSGLGALEEASNTRGCGCRDLSVIVGRGCPGAKELKVNARHYMWGQRLNPILAERLGEYI